MVISSVLFQSNKHGEETQSSASSDTERASKPTRLIQTAESFPFDLKSKSPDFQACIE